MNRATKQPGLNGWVHAATSEAEFLAALTRSRDNASRRRADKQAGRQIEQRRWVIWWCEYHRERAVRNMDSGARSLLCHAKKIRALQQREVARLQVKTLRQEREAARAREREAREFTRLTLRQEREAARDRMGRSLRWIEDGSARSPLSLDAPLRSFPELRLVDFIPDPWWGQAEEHLAQLVVERLLCAPREAHLRPLIDAILNGQELADADRAVLRAAYSELETRILRGETREFEPIDYSIGMKGGR